MALVKVLLALLIPLVGSAAHAATYLLLAFWSLGGPRRAIEALTLTWLVTFLNPGIYTLSEQSDLLRWVVIGAAFVSVSVTALQRRSAVPRTLLWLWVFAAVSGVLALTVSYAPSVSLFKLLSFTMGATTVLLGFHLTRHEAAYWRTWFLVFFVVIVLASLPLIFHSLGYVRNLRGFQGVLNHPQAYGAFLGAFVAWRLMMLFKKHLRKRILEWLLAAVALVSLFATQARTGALAAVGAMLLAMAWGVLKRPGTVHRALVWTIRLSPILALGLVVAVLNAGTVGQATKEFVLKGKMDYATVEAFQSSRGGMIEASLANFNEHPVTGIGFGVASAPSEFYIRRDPFLGLPVGASVEKGFALIALLEEVGLIGFVLFIALVGSLLWPTFRSKASIAPIALALGALLVNFGESIFFAMGGSGLLVWLLLGAARVMSYEAPQCRH